jgi:hypothetical protein
MRRTNITWGGILILLGVLFLLDRTDVININIWGLFWPLLIIWLGVQLLWRSSGKGSSADAEQLTIPIKGIEEARVKINFGAGGLHVHGRTAPDELLTGEFGPGVDYDIKEAGSRLDVEMRPPSGSFFVWPWWGRHDSRDWSIGLNETVPLSLDVNTGASKAVLNLADLNVTDLRLKTGASDTNITLPAHAGYTRVKGETGVAAVRFQVPEGVAGRIRTSGGLSDIHVDQNRFPRSGGQYESADYETAENKVDIDVSIGLGSATFG